MTSSDVRMSTKAACSMVSQSATESIDWFIFRRPTTSERQLLPKNRSKDYRDRKKIALIEAENPTWQDLSDES